MDTHGSSVSVTGIGRGLSNTALEKHKIKRADRLCSNQKLQLEYQTIYQAMVVQFGHLSSTPVILIDWSDLDDRQDKFLLRASLAIEGRSMTLYQEVHTVKTKDKPSSHQQFLIRLKAMFAESVKVIIVTDAGFRCPWFQAVRGLGWDFVGRVRNRTQCQLEPESDRVSIKTLYCNATQTPKLIGSTILAKANPTNVNLVLFKKPLKWCHKRTRQGQVAQWKQSQQIAKREREPRLLATSLKCSSKLAKRIVKIYRSRMQIEQTFRDTKNLYYGIGLSVNQTRKIERLKVLLLLAAIASLILLIIGLLAEQQGLHQQFQANTVNNRRVLSFHYLGLRIYQNEGFRLQEVGWANIKIGFKNYVCAFNEDAV